MLSNLYSETFTIINQIPTSPTNASKIKWKKHFITNCDKKDGIFDKSTGTMVYKSNSWTVFCKEFKKYKAPNWIDGYYTLPDDVKNNYYTGNIGDLIIFAKIDDIEPINTQEFQAIVNKYRDIGGLITSSEVYINYYPNGKPWSTNHIEFIKG
jgi:hypothetical protein